MNILKTFSLLQNGNDAMDHEINVQGTIENPLFQANQIGNLLDIKSIRSHIKDFDDDEKGVDTVNTLGGPQEMVFLTEMGLYKLLGRSKKPIAATFQKWMIRTIREIRMTGQYQSKKDNEVDKKMTEYRYGLKNHTMLLNFFDQKNVVYILKLRDEEAGKFIIKIGHTENIKERVQNIFSNYHTDSPFLLEVFEIFNNCKFERRIRDNEFIKKHRHSENVKKNNELSRETFLVNAEEYVMALKIINEIKESFDVDLLLLTETPQTLKLKIELEDRKMENIKLQGDYNIKQQELKISLREIELETKKISLSTQCALIEPDHDDNGDDNGDSDDEDGDDDKSMTLDGKKGGEVFQRIKKRNHGIKIPFVYQYDPSDLKTCIKVWDSPADVKRSMDSMSATRLRNVAKDNTVYKGYRWVFVKRTDAPPPSSSSAPTIEIAPTVPSKSKSPDVRYIAMIDIKKTKIMEVFKNQKDAAESRNMKTNSFSRAIQQQTVSSGHYWNFFDECSQEMQDEYLSHSTLPEKYVYATGKQVERIDHKTNQVLKTYSSISEVCKLFQMSVITLKKVMKNEDIHQGYKWRLID